MSKNTLRKKWEKNLKVVWDWVSRQMSIYNYNKIDSNRLEKRFQKQNKPNTRSKLELEATKA